MARKKSILTDELKHYLDQCKTQEDLFGKNGLAKELIGNMVTIYYGTVAKQVI